MPESTRSRGRLDRRSLRFRPLAARPNKFAIEEIAVDPDGPSPDVGSHAGVVRETAERVRRARELGAPVVICHGAHLIKNGLGTVLVRLVEEGWITHVATNGAGSIHDWEFGFQGASCEDVRAHVAAGEFGLWDETGACTGLALLVGGLDGLGYGESMGRMMLEDRLVIPSREELREALAPLQDHRASPDDMQAAALDLLVALDHCEIDSGIREVPHPWKRFSVQHACYRKGVPFTVHPGIGQDIVYSHPLVRGGAVGRASMVDFLCYAAAIHRLAGGVYLSVGSSVMSPMIFEKSLSMSRNIRLREGDSSDDFFIVVNDLAQIHWDWSRGEPPTDDPAYYVRFMKSFSRMGGELRYAGMDNRTFLVRLYHELRD